MARNFALVQVVFVVLFLKSAVPLDIIEGITNLFHHGSNSEAGAQGGHLGGVNTGAYGVPIRQCGVLGEKKQAYSSPQSDEEVHPSTFPPFSFQKFPSIECKLISGV